MGGSCDASMSAATSEEMIGKGMAHVEEAHPEMAATIKAMAPDAPEMVEWKNKFDAAWAAAPEQA
jgi:hypothetical protein